MEGTAVGTMAAGGTAILATLVVVGAIASEARFLVCYRRLILPRTK